MGGQFNTIFLEEKAIEPIGEAKSDYEIVCMIADKLGLLKEYTNGKSIKELIKESYRSLRCDRSGQLEELKEKKYYVVPPDPDWEKRKAGMYEF